MATTYNIKLTSHWVNYTPEELEQLLCDAIKKLEIERNLITIDVKKEI